MEEPKGEERSGGERSGGEEERSGGERRRGAERGRRKAPHQIDFRWREPGLCVSGGPGGLSEERMRG